ncbi:helix-turn-helix domain-containing protein [Bacillus sp. USDA818B3_A]|uniref:helix-turn-helix domain-containing protein n=1 Tax=Bacillus sp. USDA818B3_A TaxID=2698834 RepID=UPI001367CDEF|nr:helix-turn-helix domain-containing protein [Bacillus sp. USDA818B3_A]
MKLTHNDIETACKLVYNTTNIPIFFLKKNQEYAWTFTNKYSSIIDIKSLPKGLINEFFSINSTKKIQLVYIKNSNDKVAILPYPEDNDALLVLWPEAEKLFSPNVNKVLESSGQIPYDTNQLMNTAILLHYIFYKEQLSLSHVIQDNQDINTSQMPGIIEFQIMEQRENSNYHSSFLAEKKIFQNVQLGNKEKMLYYMKLHSEEGIYGTLSKRDTLRSHKNLVITAITLATRAAIEGGLYPEIAYNLSDAYIQQIEEINKINSVNGLLEDILVDFTERVAKANRSHYTKTILLCQEYIFNHLYEDLTLESLAEQLHLSPSYLSNKFKDETGETLKAFIQRNKIEEAKNLLVYSNLNISEIYSVLNFYDQSYFIKVFKKFTGCTPKQYKNNFILKSS